MAKKDIFPVQVINIIDDYKAVINAGSNQSIFKGQKFLVYSLSDEDIIDPVTQENLGKLEIIVGTGIAMHVQEKMTTIETPTYTKFDRKKIIKPNSIVGIIGGEQIVEEGERICQDPFKNINVGDLVKPIS